MSMTDQVEQVAAALLYEGYNLYPYRPSAIKNRQRWTFGVLLPKTYAQRQAGADDWRMQTECLVVGPCDSTVDIKLRLLHLVDQSLSDLTASNHPSVSSVTVGDRVYHDWQGAEEREVTVRIKLEDALSVEQPFSWPEVSANELIEDEQGRTVARLVRSQRFLSGLVRAGVQRCDEMTLRLSVNVQNQTDCELADDASRDAALLHSLVSTHLILRVDEGQFVSLFDPPQSLQLLTEECRNHGAWPVLVGDKKTRRAMLASPIILYDFPQVSAASPGDLFDGTEIDEILSLRIQTLTTDEQRQMASVDDRTRRVLERTRTLDQEQLMDMHATMEPTRRDSTDRSPARSIQVEGVSVGPGSRVRLRPSRRADSFDIVLRGMIATVLSIEEDFENNTYVTVTVDDDPGKELGRQGKTAHRFFFRPEEIEPLEAGRSDEAGTRQSILIAGIGNVLRGDDGFGVVAARELAALDWPEGVTVREFGIRGVDLGYALLDEHDAVILIDAMQGGGAPGSLYVIDPEGAHAAGERLAATAVEAHGMVPEQVLRWAQAMGAALPHVRLVGCEPKRVGSDDELIMGLSETVQAAIKPALEIVEQLVDEVRLSAHGMVR